MTAVPVTDDDMLALLGPLTEWLLRSSFKGTLRCESTAARSATRPARSSVPS